ncbi:MAG: hypothetical protein U1F43_04960 [Myxococcota bacterium]
MASLRPPSSGFFLRLALFARPPSEATALLATWVGAMTMARAVADPAQSKAIVEACRNHILERFIPLEEPTAAPTETRADVAQSA